MNRSARSAALTCVESNARTRLWLPLSQREDVRDSLPETYRFSASNVSFAEEDNVLTVGFASTESDAYVLFQRDLNFGGPDDEGVYIELNDQVNSGYSLVTKCVVAPNQLIVMLAQPLLQSQRIVVDLAQLGDENDFVAELSRIFTDCGNQFAIRP